MNSNIILYDLDGMFEGEAADVVVDRRGGAKNADREEDVRQLELAATPRRQPLDRMCLRDGSVPEIDFQVVRIVGQIGLAPVKANRVIDNR